MGSFWPTPRERLLLNVALGHGDAALASWTTWREAGRLDDTDPGSVLLLPLAYRNLARLGADDAEFSRVKGVYRRSWTANQLLFSNAATALEALRRSGIDSLVLKGAALSVLCYRDLGARPMTDVDILVPRDRAREAMGVLRELGLASVRPRPEDWIDAWHAESFDAGPANVIDLHSFALWQPADDADLWKGAVDVEIGGEPTLALCPADQLMHVCVHGAWLGITGRLRWIPDAIVVMESAGAALDWDRLVRAAASRRLSYMLAETLGYLHEALAAPVPPESLALLRKAPSSRSERAAHRAAMSPPSPMNTLRIIRDRYLRLKRLDPDGQGPGSFLAYARRTWGYEHNRSLVAHAARSWFRHTAGR